MHCLYVGLVLLAFGFASTEANANLEDRRNDENPFEGIAKILDELVATIQETVGKLLKAALEFVHLLAATLIAVVEKVINSAEQVLKAVICIVLPLVNVVVILATKVAKILLGILGNVFNTVLSLAGSLAGSL
jgi:phage-related protein